jgi:large subunit ribosomal protein L25
VPGVIYGGKQQPQLISLDPAEFSHALHKVGFFATLFDLKLDGARHRVLPRDVQFDPVTDKPIHVDFLRVTAESKVTVQVPVVFINEVKSPGLKRGGVLNVVRHEIELRCAVDAIPRSVVVDLDGLNIGDSIHISRVKLPEGVKPTIERDFTVASVAAPSAIRAEALEAQAAAAAAAAAPEVPVVGAVPGAVAPAAPGAPGAPGAPAAPAEKAEKTEKKE